MSDDTITTESPLKRRWLTMFRGYKIALTRRIPKNGMGGSIRYKTLYVLEKKNK